MVAIQCPKCSRPVSVSAVPATGSLKCPLCGALFVVPIPAASSTPSTAAPISTTTNSATNPESFDPYYTWLGIPPAEQPPNHYRLLGLNLYESNADAIDHAANRQSVHLRSCSTGPRALLAQHLLNRVAAAKICLLDAAKKREYDDELRQEFEAKNAAAYRAETGSRSTAKAHAPRPKNPVIEVAKISVGGLVGLALAYGFLALFFPEAVGLSKKASQVTNAETSHPAAVRSEVNSVDSKRSRPDELTGKAPLNPPQPTTVPPSPFENVRRPGGTDTGTGSVIGPTDTNESPDRLEKSTSPKSDSVGESTNKKAETPPATAPATVEPAQPSPTPQPAPPTVDPISQIPSHVALPPNDSMVWTTLFPLPESPGKLELIPAFDPVTSKLNLTLEKESSCATGNWQIHFERPEDSANTQGALGEFQIDSASGDLQFRWQKRDPIAAIGLSNSWLKLEIGSKSRFVALRKPEPYPAIKLDLEKERVIVPLNIESIPATNQLHFEVSDLVKLKETAALRNGIGSAKLDREIVIEFPNLPGAEVGIKFAKVPQAPLGLIVEPRFKESASREYDLTIPQLEKTRRALTEAVKEANAKIPVLSRNLNEAQSALSAIQNRSLSKNYSATQKVIDIKRAEGAVRDAGKRLVAMREQEAGAQGRLENVPKLALFIQSLHGNEIPFRVVVRASSAELVLAEGTTDFKPN